MRMREEARVAKNVSMHVQGVKTCQTGELQINASTFWHAKTLVLETSVFGPAAAAAIEDGITPRRVANATNRWFGVRTATNLMFVSPKGHDFSSIGHRT